MGRFNYESPMIGILTRIVDVVILNVLWLACSIPIITIGASTTALYYCMLKIVRKKDSSIVKMFVHSFGQNLKQGCCLTVIFFASVLFLYVDIPGCRMMDNTVGNLMKVVLVVLLIVIGFIFSYVFPILAQFDNTVKNILKNAFFMSITNLRKTIIIFVLNAIPFVLFFGIPYVFILTVPMWLMFGVAVIVLLNSKMFAEIFDNYIEEAYNGLKGNVSDEIEAVE